MSEMESYHNDNQDGQNDEQQKCRLSKGLLKYQLAASFLVAVLISLYIRTTLISDNVKDVDESDDDWEDLKIPKGSLRPWSIMASFESLAKHEDDLSMERTVNDSFNSAPSNALSVVRVNVRIHKIPQLSEDYVVARKFQEASRVEAQQALRVAKEFRTRLEETINRNRYLLFQTDPKQQETADVDTEATEDEREDTDTDDSSEDTPSPFRSCSSASSGKSAWDALPDNQLTDDAYTYRTFIRRRVDRTRKLLEHAYILDPQSSDVLTALGAFYEAFDGDWVKAEHLYARALTHNPAHHSALISRARCLPVVAEIDQRRFSQLDAKLRGLFAASATHQNAGASLARMSRERYVRIVYHNNAIEGNTLTLQQTRALLETRIAIGGKSLIEQNEVLGLDAALMYINSTLLRRSGTIQLSELLELHRRVLGYVDLDWAGRLREKQVYVGNYRPPPAVELPELMRELVDWLNSADARTLHPVELAALAHWKLVYVHPFHDGNGRTSRLLANWLLMRYGFPPVIVQVQERFKYYRMIELANVGDVRPMIRFFATLAERAIDEFLDLIGTANPHTDVADSQSHAHASLEIDEVESIEKEDVTGTILVDMYRREKVNPHILDLIGG